MLQEIADDFLVELTDSLDAHITGTFLPCTIPTVEYPGVYFVKIAEPDKWMTFLAYEDDQFLLRMQIDGGETMKPMHDFLLSFCEKWSQDLFFKDACDGVLEQHLFRPQSIC